MKYELGHKYINVKKTQTKIQSSEKADHEKMQFIENYFKALFDKDLDMSKLTFYADNPEDESKKITPDQALEQLNKGYPIMVKHEDVKDVIPFMKRSESESSPEFLYTGQEFVQLPKHRPDFGFDYKKFQKSDPPERPGAIANFFGALGIKTKKYRAFKLYERRKQILEREDSKEAIARYELEKTAYNYAEQIDEGFFLEETLEEVAHPKAKKKEKVVEAKQDDAIVVPGDNEQATLNIDAYKNAYEEKHPAPRRVWLPSDDPYLPITGLSDAEREEYLDREKSARERGDLGDTKFMEQVKAEIKGKNLSDKKTYAAVVKKIEKKCFEWSISKDTSTELMKTIKSQIRGKDFEDKDRYDRVVGKLKDECKKTFNSLDASDAFLQKVKTAIKDKDLTSQDLYNQTIRRIRRELNKYSVPEDIKMDEVIDYAKLLDEKQVKRDNATKSMRAFEEEKKLYHTLSKSEYASLNDQEKTFFEKQENNTYVSKFFKEDQKKIKDITTKVKTVARNENRIVEERSKEDVDAVKEILKRVNEQREHQKNEVAKSIAKGEVKASASNKIPAKHENEVINNPVM